MLFVLVGLPLLFIAEPFVRIRIGYIPNQRIGHLAMNTEVYIRRREADGWPKRTFSLFTCWDPANKQLLKMYKRRLNIVESRLLAQMFFACREILQKTRFYESVEWSHKPKDLTRENIDAIAHGSVSLQFTDEEERRGRALLEELGIGPDDWYACFNARDTNYFNQWRPQYAERWEKISYRNADIDSYLDGAGRITARNGFAVRVGAGVQQAIETDDPRIVDYAYNHWSDFGDIYLLAKCRFLLSCNTGLNMVPFAFNRPVAVANMVPICGALYQESNLFIPALLRRKGEDDFMHLEDVRSFDLFSPQIVPKYDEILRNNALEQINSFPEDIADLCEDMFDLLDGKPPSDEAVELQLLYQQKYQAYFGKNPPLGRLGPRFAIKYRHLIV